MKYMVHSLFCAVAALGVAACDNDDLHIGAPSGSDAGLAGSDGNVVYVTDAAGNGEESSFSFNGSGTFRLYANSSKAIVGGCTVTFAYDQEVLTAYNADNKTAYEAVPQDMVTFGNNGAVTFQGDALKSDALDVTVSGGGQLDPETVYALPLRYTVSNGTAADGGNSMVVLVHDYSKFPGADKTYNGQPGMKIIGVVEVNDHNPLNVMGFKMKDSGRQLFDMCVLFAANINVNAVTGMPYVSCNNNVQALLDDRDKYIKPLQERGIKVILGILGNHDISGISTLADDTAKEFAKEVKSVCDAYELDGVFLDDEYTDYDGAASGSVPGYVPASAYAASRMAYEIKQIQPGRLLLSYKWGELYNATAVDGKQPGEFFDYVLNDYCDTRNPVDSYPGLRQNQAGTGSWNCTNIYSYKMRWLPGYGYYFSNGSSMMYNDVFPLAGMREQGYGALMVYNFDCNPSVSLTPGIINALGDVARDLYAGELEYDGSWYPKDWN